MDHRDFGADADRVPTTPDDVERCARASDRRREIAGNNLDIVVAEE